MGIRTKVRANGERGPQSNSECGNYNPAGRARFNKKRHLVWRFLLNHVQHGDSNQGSSQRRKKTV